MFDYSNFKDVRYSDFHIYTPGKVHNFSTELDRFPGLANSFWFEEKLRVNAEYIHANLWRWYYSFYISIGYLVAIVALRTWMANRQPYNLKGALIAWNAALAIFSIVGTIRCMPEFVHVLYNNGLKHSYSQSTYYLVSFYISLIIVRFLEFYSERERERERLCVFEQSGYNLVVHNQ